MDTIPTKTSQTEFSGVDGQDVIGVGQQYGDEPTGAPGPVTEPIKGEITKIDATQTSQQKKGEHHNIEGEN